MNHRLEDKENGMLLALEGELTIMNASAVREAFRTLMASGRDAAIDLSRATAIDVTGLQLLCSIHRTGVEKGLKVSLEKGVPEEVVDVMRTTGFLREKGCSFDRPGTCLWKGVCP